MNSHTTSQQELKRLRMFLAHLVEHAQCHLQEIKEQRGVVQANAKLALMLAQSLDDMEKARLSLAAVVRELGGDEVPLHTH